MSTFHRFALPALLGLAAASCSQSPKEEEAPASGAAAGAARGTLVDMRTSVLVKAVDLEKRLITLEGPRGNTGTYKVGEQVQRLSEIRPGDKIDVEYQVVAVAELREPTAEERSSPLTLVEEGERAPSGAPPGVAIARGVRVVTTIDALDATARTLTVKGPLDGMVTVKVEDPAAFERLKVGQTIVVAFAETLLLSVAPGSR